MKQNLAKGQGLVEYALFLLVVVVVIIVVLPFIGRLFSESSEILNQTNHTLTPSVIETNESLQYGEVSYTDRTVTRVIDSQEVNIPNCNGSSEVERTRTFTKTISRKSRLITDVRLNIDIEFVLIYINQQLEISETETISDSQQITLRAAPNTSVSYVVNFVEESKVGMLEIIQGNKTQYVEFAIPATLNIQQEEPTRQSCN